MMRTALPSVCWSALSCTSCLRGHLDRCDRPCGTCPGDIDYAQSPVPAPATPAGSKPGSAVFDDYLENPSKRYCSVMFFGSLSHHLLLHQPAEFTFLVCVILQVIYLGIFALEWRWQGPAGVGAGLVSPPLGYFPGLLFLYRLHYAGAFFKRNRWTAPGPIIPVYRVMGLGNAVAPLPSPCTTIWVDKPLRTALLPLFIAGFSCLLALVGGCRCSIRGIAYFPGYVARRGCTSSIRRTTTTLPITISSTCAGPACGPNTPDHDYLETVSFPTSPKYNDPVIKRALTPVWKPGKLRRPSPLRGRLHRGGGPSTPTRDYPGMLDAMGSLHRLTINRDSLAVEPRFYYHPARKQYGLLYMIPTHEMPAGEHTVLVRTRYVADDSLAWTGYGNIYFYK